MKKVIFPLGILFLFASCKKETPQKQLTVNVTPQVGGSVAPSNGAYAMGSTVKLTATPSADYIFKEWTGGLSGTTNPTTVIMDADKIITAIFEKRQYPLSLTIVGSGTVKEEIIKTASSATTYTSGTTVRLTPQPSMGYQFKKWSGDDTTSRTTLDIVVSKPVNLTCTFEKMAISTLKIENPIDTLIISKKHKYIVKGIYADGSIIDLSDSIKITASTDGINILTNKNIVGAKSGNTILNLEFNNKIYRDTLFISRIEEIKSIDPYLTTPAKGSKLIVPVVIINYYATNNGIDIDTRRQPSYGSLDPITIEDIKTLTLDNLKLTKFGYEEGSKYRGFNDSTTDPYVGFKIVKYFNFYEIKRGMTADKSSTPVYEPDFYDIFNAINLENLVNEVGVKEIWFSLRPLSSEYPVVKSENLDPKDFINLSESRMSSPHFPYEVSNSIGLLNLPRYKKTYVVYGGNLHRSYAENIHCKGHQIERQFTHIDEGVVGGLDQDRSLFRNLFVGEKTSTPYKSPTGRCGNTHFPPNATKDYEYSSSEYIQSDIESWTPSGGNKKFVNKQNWMNKNYSYPSTTKITKNSIDLNDQFKWLVYWFQSIPGYNNNLEYTYFRDGKKYKLENWWDLFYNWDDVMTNKKTLWLK